MISNWLIKPFVTSGVCLYKHYSHRGYILSINLWYYKQNYQLCCDICVSADYAYVNNGIIKCPAYIYIYIYIVNILYCITSRNLVLVERGNSADSIRNTWNGAAAWWKARCLLKCYINFYGNSTDVEFICISR